MSKFQSFAGFCELAGTLVAPVLTVNTSDVPTAADASPTYSVYNADMASVLATGTCTALSGETGGYYVSQAITAGLGFASGGLYTVLVSYALSSAARRQMITFQVS